MHLKGWSLPLWVAFSTCSTALALSPTPEPRQLPPRGGLRVEPNVVQDRFGHIPVKRDFELLDQARKRDQRMARHQAALDNYHRNTQDDDFMARYYALFDSAKELESKSLRKRAGTAGNSVPLDDYFDGNNDILYSGPMQIGTPPQTFQIIPDTGSADLWVVSSQTSDPGHDLFNSAQSSTFNNTGVKFDDQYGLGEAAGTIASDTVTFASYTIAGKHFGVATSVDSQFQQQPNDGLIGMCSSVLSNQSTFTFFEDLMNTSMISNPYFSTYLTRGRDSTNQQGTVSGSSLCIGCIATVPSGVRTSGNLNYVPITLFAFYEIQMNSISYNGQTISQTSTQVMLDTGTTDIYLPTTVADAMMGKINGVRQSDGSYLVPASTLDTTTTFAFTFSGNAITLDILDLIDGYSSSSRTQFIMNVFAADTQDPNGADIGILGDTFLKNALTVFSYSTNGKPAVGMQQLVSSNSGIATSAAVAGTSYVPGVPTSGTIHRTGTATATGSKGAAGRAAQLDIGALGSVAAMLVGTVLGALVL